MQRVLKSFAVIAAGAGLAFVLAAAALWAVLEGFGAPSDWSAVEGTRIVIGGSAVILVHLLWIATWCVWRSAGWARYVAALLLLPVAGLLTWLVGRSAWEVSTGAGNGWSWGSDLLTQESAGAWPGVAAILAPAIVVAVGVLVTVLVPTRGDEESMFVRPAWEPRTVLRGTAITAAVLGSAVLAAILLFLLLAMMGLV